MFIVTNSKDRFPPYITTTYPNMFSLGLSAISKVFVADLNMCLFAGKNIAQKLLFFKSWNALPSKQILTQSSGRNPKARGEICWKLTVEIASLHLQLVGCLRLYSSGFWCTMSTSLFIVFAVTTSFWMSFLSSLNRFQILIYFYLLSVLYWV